MKENESSVKTVDNNNSNNSGPQAPSQRLNTARTASTPNSQVDPARRARERRVAGVAALIITVVVLALVAGAVGAWVSSQISSGEYRIPGTNFDGNTVITDDEADLAQLVKEVSPSVVSIVTTQATGSGYFRQIAEGAGTGVIVSQDGYILTNKHVVGSARSIDIIDSDGERYEDVKVVGSDPLNDLAFLKIDNVSNLPVATLGDSGTVRVGQRVIAIGNSLGQYQNTVTSGIVSGLGRPVVAALDDSGTGVESLTDLMQTDAAINPGNSGGPLINMAGQVIGINTAIVSDAQSMGFAIPINASKGLIRGIAKNGTIQKAYLGVQYMAITPEVRAEYKLSEKQGALVKSGGSESAIASGGPASRAGLRDDDIIKKVNGKGVGMQGGLGSLISEFLPGEEITLEIIRDNTTREIKVTLDSYRP